MLALPILTALFAIPHAEKQHFALRDGDRVVLVGNTLIEREQRSGYWETALTSRFPGRKLQFRNLGWSGDTVFGEARAGFDTPADGFRRLVEHTLALKPTVIVLGYGGNEAFAGPDALPAFVAGYNTLLDRLAPAKARWVFLSPLLQENMGSPLPDPTAANENLRRYSAAIREIANARKGIFIDLQTLAAPGQQHWTDNGLHLTPLGYWKSACLIEQALGYDEVARLAKSESVGLQPIQVHPKLLPFLAPDPSLNSLAPIHRITGLPDGVFALMAGDTEYARGTAKQWNEGVALKNGPDAQQAERLRAAVVAKNQLYFHRWRPQNETYLFGFRKHEQGQNAREIPAFDPLVEKAEQEIARLAVPVAHTYELKQVMK